MQREANENKITFDYRPANVQLVELNGEIKANLKVTASNNKSSVLISMPQFAIRTLKLSAAQ